MNLTLATTQRQAQRETQLYGMRALLLTSALIAITVVQLTFDVDALLPSLGFPNGTVSGEVSGNHYIEYYSEVADTYTDDVTALSAPLAQGDSLSAAGQWTFDSLNQSLAVVNTDTSNTAEQYVRVLAN